VTVAIYVKEPVLTYKQRVIDAESRKVSKPEDVIPFVRELYGLGIERFMVLYLDSKNKIRGIKSIADGTVNQVNPTVREVFRYGIGMDAASIVVAHNHPSGDPEPSREDKDWVKTCMKGGEALGIKVLDFIILARDDGNTEKYYSFADHSLMSG